jgi:hypothetical protein
MRTNRAAATTVVALTIAVMAAGCGSQPSSGTVVDKRSEPGQWETKKTCARTVGGECRQWKTTRKWDDADYELLIRDGGSEEWVEVEASVYERARVGGRWTQ